MALGPNGRYVVEKHLGDGTFGRVLACKDLESDQDVAVKVVKGVKSFCEHAQAEAEVLRDVQRLDPERRSLCVELRDSFLQPKHHYCLVFEQLGISLRDFLKRNDSLGLYLADAQRIAQQLLQSLSVLHGMGLTHNDLKCRNIMLRDAQHSHAPHPRVEGAEAMRPQDCRIAVIDFGGAMFEEERHGGRVGTRQFRAPEVVLGLEWDEAADIWSAGCIIAMLYLGKRPISVHENQEHLALMERLMEAKLPPALLKQAQALFLFDDEDVDLPEGVSFTSDGALAWPSGAPSVEAVQRVQAVRPLAEQILPRHREFLILLQGLLHLDPKQRLTAAAALKAPFFTAGKLDE